MKKTIVDAINHQIQHEQQNAHTYFAMSLWFEQQLLEGLAAWFKKQAADETGHANRFIEHLLDSNESPKISALQAPKNEFASVLEAVKITQALERKTTSMIYDLCNLAAKEGDLATVEAMQWFIKEQVEEEKWAEQFVQMATKIGDHVGSMFMWDHRVAKLASGE